MSASLQKLSKFIEDKQLFKEPYTSWITYDGEESAKHNYATCGTVAYIVIIALLF